MYKIAQYINKGAIITVCHDKGEREVLEDTFNKRYQLNDDRKKGVKRGKFKDATKFEMLPLDKTANETNMIPIKSLRKNVHKENIISEIMCRKYPGEEYMELEKSKEEMRAMHQCGVRDLKEQLRKMLGIENNDEFADVIKNFNDMQNLDKEYFNNLVKIG